MFRNEGERGEDEDVVGAGPAAETAIVSADRNAPEVMLDVKDPASLFVVVAVFVGGAATAGLVACNKTFEAGAWLDSAGIPAGSAISVSPDLVEWKSAAAVGNNTGTVSCASSACD